MASPIIDITTDGHVHTRLCLHAVGEMEDYVEAALKAGLGRIIFLEHYETGICYFERTWLTDDDFAFYHEEGRRLAARYQGRIDVGVGVEVGANPERFEETIDFLRRYRWHRIGLSYHYVRHGDVFVNVVSRRKINLELMEKIGFATVADAYFDGLKQAIEVIPANVVCHLDAVLRHCSNFSLADRHVAALRTILASMEKRKIALEVNTSGYALRNQPFPAPWIVREAMDMGVSLVAGSDAHRPEDVGRFFERLPALVA